MRKSRKGEGKIMEMKRGIEGGKKGISKGMEEKCTVAIGARRWVSYAEQN